MFLVPNSTEGDFSNYEQVGRGLIGMHEIAKGDPPITF